MIKQLHRFLDMVKYYRDLWVRHSKMLSPLTLVGEHGHTKATRVAKSKWKLGHWDNEHWTTLNNIKTKIAKESGPILTTKEFKVYTDSTKFQLGAVTTQNNRTLVFWGRILNKEQQKYSMTK